MSIRSQLPAAVPFISIRRVLEGLAAEENLPFEVIAKFLLDRIDSMPQAITCDMDLEYKAVPKESVANLLASAMEYLILGFEYDPEIEKSGPFDHDYDLDGWNSVELAAWLKQNGVSAAICKTNKQKDAAIDTAPPEASEPIKASAPAPEVVQKFATYDDNVLMNIRDACLVTGLSRTTINRKIDDGSLKKMKIGRTVRITVGSLRKLINVK